MVKRFKFRLGTVLSLRRFEEKQALQALAETLAQIQQIDEYLKRLHAQRIAVLEETSRVVQGEVGSLRDLPGLEMSVEQIEELIELGKKALERQNEILEERRDEVAERRGIRKGMEELEARAKRRHLEETNKSEASEQDDIAAQRYMVRNP